MMTTPSIWTLDRLSRIASTAAASAPSLLPRPTQRAAASAADSVTRTSSIARFRSGRCGPGLGMRSTVVAARPARYSMGSGRLVARTGPSPLAPVSDLPAQPAGTCLAEQDLLAVGGDLTLVEQIQVVHGRAFRASMIGLVCWWGICGRAR